MINRAGWRGKVTVYPGGSQAGPDSGVLLTGFLNLLSYINWDHHQLRGDTAHSGLALPHQSVVKKMYDRPICGGHFEVCSSQMTRVTIT